MIYRLDVHVQAHFSPLKELDIWLPGEHNGTFRGNQLAMVAAKAGLEFMLDNNIEAEAKRKETIIRDFLEKNVARDGVKIRGIGCIFGIDVGTGEKASAILRACFNKGLIIELAGRDNSVVKPMPALTIPDDILMKGLQIIKEAVDEVM